MERIKKGDLTAQPDTKLYSWEFEQVNETFNSMINEITKLGISGNSSILISKAVLDLFTGSIFAITLGVSVSIIAIPMVIILTSVYFLAGVIAPFVSNIMLLNFMACGGILTIAAGMLVSGIKNTPIGNMLPALILVMPLSYIWSLLPV